MSPAEQKVCEQLAERAKTLVEGQSLGRPATLGFGAGAGVGVFIMALAYAQTDKGPALSSANNLVGVFVGAGVAVIGGLVGAAAAAFKNERLQGSAYAGAMDACLEPVVLTQTLGPGHPDVPRSLRALAYRYYRQAEFAQAEPLYQRALAIQETALGPEAPEVATTLDDYAALLRQTNRPAEAATLEQRARAIRAKR